MYIGLSEEKAVTIVPFFLPSVLSVRTFMHFEFCQRGGEGPTRGPALIHAFRHSDLSTYSHTSRSYYILPPFLPLTASFVFLSLNHSLTANFFDTPTHHAKE
mmetsp:Transcript_39543/g.77836  ORF Transcript_39543/g.77836 Transcript_39543/m.77836 type:complete len:102 (-) Transcript_39543:58-363(-)